MKDPVFPNSPDAVLTDLVTAGAGALTATLAAKLLGRPRPAKRRRDRKAAPAAARGRRTAPVKGGGRHG